MTFLHEMLAAVKGANSARQTAVTDANHLLQRTQPFGGLRRSYTPKEEGGQQFPDENQILQARVYEVISTIMSPWARHLDTQATIDAANQSATANVEIDGTVIVADVPIPHLLFLEKQAADLVALVEKLPVLDPNEAWTYDPNLLAWTTEPVETTKTRKESKQIVVIPPTDRHPGQWTEATSDVIAGTWSTQKLSGAIPFDVKQALRGRVRKLQDAVKAARQRANVYAVTPVAEGAELLNYVFAPLVATP